MTLPPRLVLPPRTVVERGGISSLPNEAAQFGARGILVHGGSLEDGGGLAGVLSRIPEGMEIATWRHAGGEPTLKQLERLLAWAREKRPDWMAGVGGGSVIDIAKACAGLLDAPLSVKEYHAGADIPASRVPFVAAPTTAGTGSEATIVSVLTDEEENVKKSIRHPSFMARLVILDSDLLLTCPPAVIAASGMDAFTQAVESYVSNRASRFSEMLSLEAAKLVALNLEAVFEGAAGDRAQGLLEGSYLAGLALSHARLGVVHGLAHPLGHRYRAPHGLVCAVCLPAAIEFNRAAMGGKYGALGSALGGDLLDTVHGLLSRLRLESPFRGKPLRDRDAVVRETLASGSTAANPRPVDAQDVANMLDALFC